MKNWIGRAITLACVALSGGCYTYAQAELPTLTPDAYVHLFLTRKGLQAIPTEAVPTSTTYISGRVQQQSADSVLIEVPVSLSVQGNGARDLAQRVYVPVSEIISVERRQFNAPRTVLAFVGGIGFVSVTVLGVSSAGKTSDADKSSANPD